MKRFPAYGPVREVVLILIMAIFIAFVYNYFSPHSLPLIRTEPLKVALPDSLLFVSGRHVDSARIFGLLKDAEEHRPSNAVAPLHKKALANPDSVAKVAEKETKTLFRTVSTAQVKRILTEHRVLVFDARTAEEYRKGHIRGSKNVPGEDIGPHFPDIAPLPRDTLIVVYCTGPLCNLGRSLAQFLQVMEFTNVCLYDEGWEGWEKAKLDTDTVFTSTGD